MRIIFISNYMNHHQLPMSDALYNILGEGNYYFIQTEPIEEERLNMGWHQDFNRKYLIDVSRSTIKKEYSRKLANMADVVIIGACKKPLFYIAERNKNCKITFRYSERLLKKSLLQFFSSKRKKVMHELYKANFNPNEYLLCASAYTAFDFSLYGLYKNKMLKWGYFPKTIQYNVKDLMAKKQHDVIRILWVGRYIDWKHPEDAIKAVAQLSVKNYHLSLIGTGPMKAKLESLIKINKLESNVTVLSAMSPEEVRGYMEISNIFLFTSDYNEGWGAVLNEAMNSGCTVIASHAAGATPFMIEHGKNGIIYKSGDIKGITKILDRLLKNQDETKRIGEEAHNTIVNVWNAENASSRLIDFCTELINNNQSLNIMDGPCSKTIAIKQWKMYKVSKNKKDDL
ncbi:glycosyltransferase family 4 protein [Brevibacterium sp. PAMC21349]|nr:glycosyltransferase family 4 protein [Brevibacterium sp. PAMC21349]